MTSASYGCTRCQKSHTPDQPEFDRHLMLQDKHGIVQVNAYPYYCTECDWEGNELEWLHHERTTGHETQQMPSYQDIMKGAKQ